jgi:hypothetical protein
MAWVYLDDQFPEHPKVIAAGPEAAWLYVCGLAYVKRHGTRGFISAAVLPRISDVSQPVRRANRLVSVGLWRKRTDGEPGYEIHDYDEWNRTADARSAAGRKAARARWGSKDDGASASESHSDRTASGNAIASESHMPQDAQSPPIPSLATSQTPTDVSSAGPPGGGRQPIIDQATAIVVAHEIARRQANGDPVRSPDGYARTRHKPTRAQHEAAWHELLERTPDLTAQQLADYATGSLKVTPLDESARAARALRNRDRSCPTCSGSGLTLDHDDLAVPCPTCQHEETIPA